MTSSDDGTEGHVRAAAAIARASGDSPGRCELCGWIIGYDEPYGECPDTDALACQNCLDLRKQPARARA